MATSIPSWPQQLGQIMGKVTVGADLPGLAGEHEPTRLNGSTAWSDQQLRRWQEWHRVELDGIRPAGGRLARGGLIAIAALEIPLARSRRKGGSGVRPRQAPAHR
jgi:hypothetical protein